MDNLKTILLVVVGLAILAGGLYGFYRYQQHQREKAVQAAEAEARSKINDLNKYLSLKDTKLKSKESALLEAEDKLAEKAKEIKARNRKLQKQTRTISELKKKENPKPVSKTSTECDDCFKNYSKSTRVYLKDKLVYDDPNCLDNKPGELKVNVLGKIICGPYQDAARDIAIESSIPEEKPLVGFVQKDEIYTTVATDGVHLGYRHQAIRIGPAHVKPTFEGKFDPRSDRFSGFAGVEVTFEIP